MTRRLWLALMSAGWFCATQAPAAAPQPVGTSTTVVTYDTAAGPVSFSRELDYEGLSIADAVHFPGSENIGGFNAVDRLGRRTVVIPSDPSVQGPNETLLRHGVYKVNEDDLIDIHNDFFAGLDPDGSITVSIENIQFDQPVTLLENTFMLHLLWDLGQVDQLGPDRAYDNPHNHHLASSFRDFDSFFGPGLPFTDNPVPNYVLGDVAPDVTYHAADEISVSITFPYSLMQHLQDDGAGVPEGLPGPGGFLEPFHFHMEYLVVPEPHGGLLAVCGALATAALRRREG